MPTDKNASASSVTCLAPINIAVIKYWGKRDEELNLPLHSSLSLTLNIKELSSKTTITASSELEDDELWLNGQKAEVVPPRLKRVIDEVRRQCYKRRREESDKFWVAGVKLKISSENNFPTAAGLASSASGYAAVAYGLCKLFDLKGDVSLIARLGSGSACRSTLGGFVRWDKGECTYGADSLARQIASEEHWPNLHVLILVVNDQRKEVGSTDGMKRSYNTSELLQYRADYIIPDRIKKMEKAILDRNFDVFAELTMKDSNQFHAVCQDTYPPIEPPYLAPISHDIIQLVTELNQVSGKNIAAYTFDAGPNAFVFTLEEHLRSVIATISAVFLPLDSAIDGRRNQSGYFRGLPLPDDETFAVNAVTTKIAARRKSRGAVDTVKYVIHTKSGSGPKLLEQLP